MQPVVSLTCQEKRTKAFIILTGRFFSCVFPVGPRFFIGYWTISGLDLYLAFFFILCYSTIQLSPILNTFNIVFH